MDIWNQVERLRQQRDAYRKDRDNFRARVAELEAQIVAHKAANVALGKQAKGWKEYGEQVLRAETAEAKVAELEALLAMERARHCQSCGAQNWSQYSLSARRAALRDDRDGEEPT